MANAGFRLRKWKTNDPKLKRRIGSMETVGRKEEIVGRLEDEETYAKSKLECQGGSRGERSWVLSGTVNQTPSTLISRILLKGRKV